MIHVLHLADLHLGWRPQALAGREAERQRERDSLLRRAVDWALRPSSEVALVVIAGDLFDHHRPPEELVRAVLDDLGRLTRAGIELVTVPGNHDELTYHDSVYRMHAAEWPGILIDGAQPARVATREIQGFACHLYGSAYVGGLTRTDSPLERFPRTSDPGLHLAVFHGSLDPDAAHRSLPLRPEALSAAGYDYVALGHVHRHRQHPLGRTVAVYPGAVEGRGFDDPGVGHLTVVRLGDGPPRLEAVPIDARPIRSTAVDVTHLDGAGDPTNFIEAVSAAALEVANQAAIQRIRLTGVPAVRLSAELLDRLWERLQPHFYYLELEDATRAVPEEAAARWAGEPTVRGLFIQRMQRAIAAATDPSMRARLERALWRGLDALEGVR
ncbi:MAG TPA: DNA repair exonuclease [Limnochordia bacterium]